MLNNPGFYGILLACGAALCTVTAICALVICCRVRLLAAAAVEIVDLLRREDERQRRLLAFLRTRNFDPPKNGH
jgi:hypothetical protein